MEQCRPLLLIFFVLSSSATESDLSIPLADFSLKLLQEGTEANCSAILSPVSVAIAVAMTHIGAEGNTKAEIGQALAKGTNDEDILEYYSQLMSDLSTPATEYTLNSANKLFNNKAVKILKAYEDIIKSKFGGNLKEMDFSKAAEAVKEINEWVESQTNSKIKDLLSAEQIDSKTVLILVNAIYFKGDWEAKFNESLTVKKPFHFAPGNEKEVDMMRKVKKLHYTENEIVQVLQLPYKNKEISMYIFLPKEKFGLDSLVHSLTGQKIIELTQQCSADGKVEVELPKFKLEKKIGLKDALKKVGIKDAFDSTKASFPKIANITGPGIYISDAVHKAFIEVNEEGSEAAAATGMIMQFRSMPRPERPLIKFIADHPFMFVIMKNNVIFFIGKVF